jgi:thioesterase domain-containing protein/acyl carrier protein
VELGEIEAALCKLPGIDAALCTAYDDASGQKSLAAYVQTADAQAFDPARAKELLAATLPDFMIPAYLIALQAFPLSANGKIDRRALPGPGESARRAPPEPPRTPLQASLQELWHETLGRTPIGIRDDFFDVGGHSLLAVVLVGALHKRLGVSVPLSTIVAHPTIEALSQHLEALSAHAPAPAHPPDEAAVLLEGKGQRTLFFVYDGLGETLLYRGLAARLGTMFRSYGLMPATRHGIPLAHASVQDMAGHALRTMRRIQPQGPYRIGGLCAGGVIAFEMAAQLEQQGETVDVILLDAYVPQARRRSGLLARARVHRLVSIFRPAATAQAPGPLTRLRQAAGKLLRATHWELQSRGEAIVVRGKLRLLHHLLRQEQAWPQWLAPLSVPQIFESASSRYRPGVLPRARVALFLASRAQLGVKNDEPMSTRFVDEDLGWSAHAARSVICMHVPGGHSTMLREPNVDELALRIKEFLLYPAAPPPAPIEPRTTRRSSGATTA